MRATGSHHPATLVNHWALMALTWCGVGYIIENGIQFDRLGNYLLVHCFGASQRVGSDIRLMKIVVPLMIDQQRDYLAFHIKVE